ncbi:MAG TPA: type III-A CRISPR-associated RAMP protein Csm3 [Candidatus Competibacteraceae bacterium]|nr:type III-A CRISPR-associated RAMP protein Csm3 [Candidatus Competibacteraceae bacterium]
MKLTAIRKLTGQIELVTGLHIGSGNNEMHIGGTDNPVIKHPRTLEPYIPGSSVKGKIRSLLEWRLGVVGVTEGNPLGFRHIEELSEKDRPRAKDILRLFGGAPEGAGANTALVEEIGPTRLAFWDCALARDWVEEMNRRNLLLTETKMENMIDRIRGVAEHPRNTERVPAGARFEFALTIRVHDGEDLMPTVYEGLRLLELTGLGGSGSRGYGKVRFEKLDLDGQNVLPELAKVNLVA